MSVSNAEIEESLIGFANAAHVAKTEALKNTAVENVLLQCPCVPILKEDGYGLKRLLKTIGFSKEFQRINSCSYLCIRSDLIGGITGPVSPALSLPGFSFKKNHICLDHGSNLGRLWI